MKVIKFPDEGVTVKIPKQFIEDNEGNLIEREIYVEKKPHQKLEKYQKKSKNFDLLEIVINIAFFCLVNGDKVNVHDLDPPAKLKIKCSQAVKDGAIKKGKPGGEYLAWLDEHTWTPFSTEAHVNSRIRVENWDGDRFGEVESNGWEKDPPIGWGC
jgi:hypothetical protein